MPLLEGLLVPGNELDPVELVAAWRRCIEAEVQALIDAATPRLTHGVVAELKWLFAQFSEDQSRLLGPNPKPGTPPESPSCKLKSKCADRQPFVLLPP